MSYQRIADADTVVLELAEDLKARGYKLTYDSDREGYNQWRIVGNPQPYNLEGIAAFLGALEKKDSHE